MANSVDPDQTAPIGAVCSGSTLFASELNLSVSKAIICSRQLQQTTFSDTFFLGALRANFTDLDLYTSKSASSWVNCLTSSSISFTTVSSC